MANTVMPQLSASQKTRIAQLRKRFNSPAHKARMKRWQEAMSEPCYIEAMQILRKDTSGL